MSETKRNFDTLLVQSIEDGLVKVLGDESAKCVTFYIDPHIAAANPDNYAKSILKLFGIGSKVMFDSILDELHEKTGTAKSEATSFGSAVTDARQSFQQRGQIKV
ncbi:MAG: hypothetical protein OK449_07765 [Thaumarchaeota archaeon]|nr:hypothetical protein [Nitrososphaerota archaeon]